MYLCGSFNKCLMGLGTSRTPACTIDIALSRGWSFLLSTACLDLYTCVTRDLLSAKWQVCKNTCNNQIVWHLGLNVASARPRAHSLSYSRWSLGMGNLRMSYIVGCCAVLCMIHG